MTNTPTVDSARQEYAAFIEGKSQADPQDGFEPLWLPDFLYDFQSHLTGWSIRKGRSAILADCGLGKTPMQLVWAENVVRHMNGRVLILTPLAVAAQTCREAAKFGIEAARSVAGELPKARIVVTNYERLHLFDPEGFEGVVCDESGILKSFDGVTRNGIIEFMRTRPYRLLCTATAAPNDFYELGNSSEALGYLGFMDMLTRFFRNARNNASLGRAWANQGGGSPQWRFRGHAERPFWRWVCSWARSLRRPSDLGFDDGPFKLPDLVENDRVVEDSTPPEGVLFAVPAVGFHEERAERRRTLDERCELAAELANNNGDQPVVAWCQLNDEGDLLTRLIDGAVQVSGRDSDESKEGKFEAFTNGEIRALVTKPVIGAWGLNWQHCSHMVSFASHSFEQYYQSVRRFWRFGQTKPVVVDRVVSMGESRVLANLRRKQEQAERLFEEIILHIQDEIDIARSPVDYHDQPKVPSWL